MIHTVSFEKFPNPRWIVSVDSSNELTYGRLKSPMGFGSSIQVVGWGMSGTNRGSSQAPASLSEKPSIENVEVSEPSSTVLQGGLSGF